MQDWLRRDPRTPPTVLAGGFELPIVVRRLARARRMTLRLAPDGSEARVSMPEWGRTADALAFARSRADWLAHQRSALHAPRPPAPGSTIVYRGAGYALNYRPDAPRRPVFDGNCLHVGGPEAGIPRRIRSWLEAEARTLLTQDLAEYCARAGRAVPRLALSGARRRWGSCAADGAIRINWRLVMAPDAVRRSVVAHEVAHLIHFDHSPQFHALLARLFEGNVRDANAWLKREGPGLFQHFG